MYFRKSFNGLLTLAVRVNKTAILTLVKNTSKSITVIVPSYRLHLLPCSV